MKPKKKRRFYQVMSWKFHHWWPMCWGNKSPTAHVSMYCLDICSHMDFNKKDDNISKSWNLNKSKYRMK